MASPSAGSWLSHITMLNLQTSWGLCAVIGLLVLWRIGTSRSRRSSLPLPPGPTPLPIIGNMLDVPQKDMEAGFRKLNKQYGTSLPLSSLLRRANASIFDLKETSCILMCWAST